MNREPPNNRWTATPSTDSAPPRITRRSLLAASGALASTIVLFDIEPAEGSSQPRSYAYVVDTNKCIGCGNCVRACSRENEVPEQFFRTWVERYTVTTAGQIVVESKGGGRHGFGPSSVPEEQVAKAFFVPKGCNQCAQPPCVQVCPIGATFRTNDGVVLVDSEHCMGCGYCVQSCPYSARFMNPATHTADKCTWCYHRITKGLAPACVAVCPVGARRFGEVTAGSEMQKFLVNSRLQVLKGELGTEPRVHYLGLSAEVH